MQDSLSLFSFSSFAEYLCWAYTHVGERTDLASPGHSNISGTKSQVLNLFTNGVKHYKAQKDGARSTDQGVKSVVVSVPLLLESYF